MQEEFKNLFSLEGKTALVTGGAQGLGKSISEGLAYFGANVAIVDIDEDTANKTSKEINLSCQCEKTTSMICDVTNEKQVKDTINKVIDYFGKIDILVANAGISDRNAAEDMTIDQWDRVINVNLKGVWLFNQNVGKHMIEHAEGGSIINIASVTAIVGILTGNANYSASKGGITALTRTLAVEWSKYNIRVNSVAPAQVSTYIIEKVFKTEPEKEKYFLDRIPLGRFGKPIDIAGPVIFLASSAASWITGHLLVVDGGNTIMF